MTTKFLFFLSLFLVSCSNWKYKDISYERCEYLEKLHVHL